MSKANLNINHYFTHIHKERKKKPLDPFNNSSLNWLLDPGKSNLVFKSSTVWNFQMKSSHVHLFFATDIMCLPCCKDGRL
jgi:hypothetical protein